MTTYLVNPSHVAFGIGVITPRWLYVLAAATPSAFGDPVLVDETLESFDTAGIGRGDVVGIGIHTGNALRGYEIGNAARAAGAEKTAATTRCASRVTRRRCTCSSKSATKHTGSRSRTTVNCAARE